MRKLYSAVGFLGICLTSGSLQADTIVRLTDFTGASFSTEYIGQGFETGLGGDWTDITFNFFSSPGTPYALGTLYLFDQPFTGTPSTLSAAAPGFIATDSSISGGVYVFDPSVLLLPITQYYVYADTAFPSGSITGGLPGSVGESGTFATFGTVSPTGSYSALPDLPNFVVDGTYVPEPGTASCLLLGALGLVAGAVWRRGSIKTPGWK